MVSQVSLQNIIDADWSKQYLTSSGTVQSRGFCSRLVTFLRQAPYIGGLFARFFPKPDIFKASDVIKREITQLIAGGKTAEDTVIVDAAKKVNELVYKIANKQPQNASQFTAALINVKDLIVQQPRVEAVVVAERPPQPPAENVATPQDDAQLPDLMVLEDIEQNRQPESVEVQVRIDEPESKEAAPTTPPLSVEEFPTPAEAKRAQLLSARIAEEKSKKSQKPKKPKTANVVKVRNAQVQPEQDNAAVAPRKKHSSRHADRK